MIYLPIGIPLKITNKFNSTKAKFNNLKCIFIVNQLTDNIIKEHKNIVFQFCIVEIGVIKNDKVEVKPCVIITKNLKSICNSKYKSTPKSINFPKIKKEDILSTIITGPRENLNNNISIKMKLKDYNFPIYVINGLNISNKIESLFVINQKELKLNSIYKKLNSIPIIEIDTFDDFKYIQTKKDTELILTTLSKKSILFQIQNYELKNKKFKIDEFNLKYIHYKVNALNIQHNINLIMHMLDSISHKFGAQEYPILNYNSVDFKVNNIKYLYLYIFNFINYYDDVTKTIIIATLFKKLHNNSTYQHIKFYQKVFKFKLLLFILLSNTKNYTLYKDNIFFKKFTLEWVNTLFVILELYPENLTKFIHAHMTQSINNIPMKKNINIKTYDFLKTIDDVPF